MGEAVVCRALLRGTFEGARLEAPVRLAIVPAGRFRPPTIPDQPFAERPVALEPVLDRLELELDGSLHILAELLLDVSIEAARPAGRPQDTESKYRRRFYCPAGSFHRNSHRVDHRSRLPTRPDPKAST